MAAVGGKPRWVFVALQGAGLFLIRTVILMMGPLLVALSQEFHTSVASAGQLAAAISATWALTALVAGPASDLGGRRLLGLTGLAVMAVGLLGSALAGSYGGLLATRLLTGIGGALVAPNGMAALADLYPSERRGRAIAAVVAAGFLGPVAGLPLVALLLGRGGWRLPFLVLACLCLLLLALQALRWPPQPPPAGGSLALLARLRSAAGQAGLGPLLTANLLYQVAALALLTYLPALLMRAHGLGTEATAGPLAAVMAAAMVGVLGGGAVAARSQRCPVAALALAGGGLLAACGFGLGLAALPTLVLLSGATLLLSLFEPLSWTLMAERAAEFRATANGLLATSNQLGTLLGASLGGLALATGGFPLLGMLCLAAGGAAALLLLRDGGDPPAG